MTSLPLLPLRERSGRSPYQLAFFGLLAALVLIVLLTFLDYGLGWDEEVHRVYGDTVMRWYATLGQDKSALFQSPAQISSYGALNIYGAFYEVVAHVLSPLLPFGLYENRHLVSAGFGLLGIVAAYLVGSHLVGQRAGFLAAFFLALTPPFYGHMFFNPKDTPFASLSLLSIYALFRLFDELPAPRKRTTAWCAVAIGMTLGMRVGGVLLYAYLGFIIGGWLLLQNLERGANPLFPLLRTIAVIGALAWGVMLIFWPWAQMNPIANPLDALRLTIYFDFKASPGSLFFEGRDWPIQEVPQSYIPTLLAVSLPELYFVAFAAGIFTATAALLRSRYTRPRVVFALKIATLILAAGLPLTAPVIRHSVVYDGLRLFLFVLPPLAVLAGISASAFLSSRAPALLKAAFVVAVAGSAVVTVFDLAQLHPYEYVYFNRLFGGGEQAGAQRFETDYWGTSYKEGVAWLVDNYRPNLAERVRVANCSRTYLSGYFLDKTSVARTRFVAVAPNNAPHILLSTTRFNCHAVAGGQTLHVVQRAGVPLLYVQKIRD